ncbi:MAG: S-adenosylmethionine:diacylglycerol 3-amino-3-carboxypropyl transferase-like protein [Microgenomates group bacterium GW2011_GWC1_38_14]|nr:MAG: S-adenosylmethionine:diacylglycerol 3-amino-3-carboxypropyl transferase-like protein [Microgenomates group bacterium GW2011_GWC1_38_14]
MNKESINYSQCWEDPRILLEALVIGKEDCVLSVTSGGDNTLALLLAGPKKIFSVDLNAAQNHLLELKRAAAKNLNYEEYLEFLGVQESARRMKLFRNIHTDMPSVSQVWWLSHTSLIKQGLVNCGRFERFTSWFARYLLPLIHSKKIISKLLSCRNIDEQKVFYRDWWDTRRWRFFFGLASNRLTLRRFARQRGMFVYVEGETVVDVYRKRLERHLALVPIQGNFFLHYSLTGKYGDALPTYLEEKGYARLRTAPESVLSLVTANLLNYLQSMPADTFSKFNLSDVFEALSQTENDILWEQIIRTAKPGAIVAYWNNLVPRSYPTHLSPKINTDDNHTSQLRAKDRVFFYDSFHAHTILK